MAIALHALPGLSLPSRNTPETKGHSRVPAYRTGCAACPGRSAAGPARVTMHRPAGPLSGRDVLRLGRVLDRSLPGRTRCATPTNTTSFTWTLSPPTCCSVPTPGRCCLDFHLAQPPLSAGSNTSGWLGGTFGYMSPEQRLAFAAVRRANPCRRGWTANPTSTPWECCCVKPWEPPSVLKGIVSIRW